MNTTTYLKSSTPINFDSYFAGSAILAKQAVDTVSKKYQFLSTANSLQIFAEHGLYPYEYRQARVRADRYQGYQKHQVIFRPLQSFESALVRNESYKLGICLQNSHKADSSFAAFLYVEVCKCLNGLHVPSLYGSFSFRHVGCDARESLNNNLADLISRFSNLQTQIERMRNTIVDRHSALSFAKQAIMIRYPDNYQRIDAYDLICPIRSSDYGDRSLWLLFNNVQERLIRGLFRYTRPDRSFIRARQITGLQTETKLNQSLWSLADQFAN